MVSGSIPACSGLDAIVSLGKMLTIRRGVDVGWKRGESACMNGCEQVNEACCIKCSECPSRVEKRTSPFTICAFFFFCLSFSAPLCYFCFFVRSLSATSSTIHSVLQGA